MKNSAPGWVRCLHCFRFCLVRETDSLLTSFLHGDRLLHHIVAVFDLLHDADTQVLGNLDNSSLGELDLVAHRHLVDQRDHALFQAMEGNEARNLKHRVILLIHAPQLTHEIHDFGSLKRVVYDEPVIDANKCTFTHFHHVKHRYILLHLQNLYINTYVHYYIIHYVNYQS